MVLNYSIFFILHVLTESRCHWSVFSPRWVEACYYYWYLDHRILLRVFVSVKHHDSLTDIIHVNVFNSCRSHDKTRGEEGRKCPTTFLCLMKYVKRNREQCLIYNMKTIVDKIWRSWSPWWPKNLSNNTSSSHLSFPSFPFISLLSTS